MNEEVSRSDLKDFADGRSPLYDEPMDIAQLASTGLRRTAKFALKLLDEKEGLEKAVRRFQEKALDAVDRTYEAGIADGAKERDGLRSELAALASENAMLRGALEATERWLEVDEQFGADCVKWDIVHDALRRPPSRSEGGAKK